MFFLSILGIDSIAKLKTHLLNLSLNIEIEALPFSIVLFSFYILYIMDVDGENLLRRYSLSPLIEQCTLFVLNKSSEFLNEMKMKE